MRDGALSEGGAALDAGIIVEFPGRQDEQETLANGLGDLAFGAIEFARDEISELCVHLSAMVLIMSRKTLIGDWVESMGRTRSSP